MGRTFSRLVNISLSPFKFYNFENRAQKAIEHRITEPLNAPKHKSTQPLLDQFAKDHPELLEIQSSKDESLLERVGQMNVKTVESDAIEQGQKSTKRKLPENRRFEEDKHELSYLLPRREIPGKVSLSQAMVFIELHQSDPTRFSPENIAKDHSCDAHVVTNILNHFRPFQLFIPLEDKRGETQRKFGRQQEPELMKVTPQHVPAALTSTSREILERAESAKPLTVPISDSGIPQNLLAGRLDKSGERIAELETVNSDDKGETGIRIQRVKTVKSTTGLDADTATNGSDKPESVRGSDGKVTSQAKQGVEFDDR